VSSNVLGKINSGKVFIIRWLLKQLLLFVCFILFLWLLFIEAHLINDSIIRAKTRAKNKAQFFFFFCGTGVWTQGFTLARQALYHLRHHSSPFWSDYFGDWVSLFAQANLDHSPLIHASYRCWDDMPSYWLTWGSHKLFARAGLKPWSSWP
jgi:hypothetical protein